MTPPSHSQKSPGTNSLLAPSRVAVDGYTRPVPSTRILPPDAIEPVDCPAEETSILATIAAGHRGVHIPEPTPDNAAGVHRAALVLETISEILAQGEFQSSVPTFGGIVATEWTTAQRGSVRFLANPTGQPLDGGAFPAPANCRLEPGQIVPWLHDFPIGPSGNYLNAYAGLVKSDAPVVHAGIRPDPHPGALVVVHGSPGTTAQIVVFHTGRGTPVDIEFQVEPTVHKADSCVVVALPTALAGTLHVDTDSNLDAFPWKILPDGTRLCWKRANVDTRYPLSCRLDPAPKVLLLNGVPANPDDFDVDPGSHVLDILLDPAHPANPLLFQNGACTVTELDCRDFDADPSA